MRNKVLVSVYAIALDEKYDIYVPVGAKVGRIGNLIVQAIGDLADYNLKDNGYCIMDVDTGTFYDLNSIIKDTNIRNDKKLILFSSGG